LFEPVRFKISKNCVIFNIPIYFKYILNYVEEKQVSIGNDETYLPVVFNNESISVTLKSLKSGKAPGVDDIPNDFLKYGGDSMVRSLTNDLIPKFLEFL
jgi:hypothetical protein